MQHVEEAAHLRHVRSVLVRAPHVRLLHLGRLDERIAAHLDGVSVAGRYGVELALQALERPGVGEVFVATRGAIEHRDVDRLDRLRMRIVTFDDVMAKAVDNLADAIAIPKPLHRQHSESYGQSTEQAQADGANSTKLNEATERDLKAIEANMAGHMDAKCQALYAEWAQEIRDKIEEDPKYFEKFLKAIIGI